MSPKLQPVILGLDPGLRNLGWALLSERGWQSGVLILEGRFSARMLCFSNWLETSARFINVMGVESLTAGNNLSLTANLKAVIGIAACHAARLGIPVFEIRPASHRWELCGRGATGPLYDQAIIEVAGYLPSISHAADAISVAEVTRRIVSRTVQGKTLKGVSRL